MNKLVIKSIGKASDVSPKYDLTSTSHMESESKLFKATLESKLTGVGKILRVEKKNGCFEYEVDYNGTVRGDVKQEILALYRPYLSINTKDGKDLYYLRFHKLSECQVTLQGPAGGSNKVTFNDVVRGRRDVRRLLCLGSGFLLFLLLIGFLSLEMLCYAKPEKYCRWSVLAKR